MLERYDNDMAQPTDRFAGFPGGNSGGFALILCLTALIVGMGWTQWADQKILDTQFAFLRSHFPRPSTDRVVIVAVDQETIENLREPIGLWHAHLGQFLEVMSKAGAAAVAVDVVLPDRSVERVAPGLDLKLTRSILTARQTTPVVFALTVDRNGKPRPVFPPFLAAAGPDSSGYALWLVDGDGVVRRFDERLGAEGAAVSTLAGQTARRLGAAPRHGLMDFSRGTPFSYVPLHRVLEWARTGEAGQLKHLFDGKVVVLGTVLPFEDLHKTPVMLTDMDGQGISGTPGVMLHAQALRNLIDEHLLRDVPLWIVWLLVGAATLIWFVAGRPVIALVGATIALLLLAVASTVLLATGWYLPSGGIAAAFVFAVGGRVGMETLQRVRERRQLRQAFSGYVSPGVMQQILAGRIRPEPGGTSQFVCVLFADIRNYTTRSEGMTAGEVIIFLNRYFERIVTVVHAHGGAVVSFMGDGIMAVFGVPQRLDAPCAAGFAAAKAMLAAAHELSLDAQKGGQAPIEIGVGLHAGEAVVGHVGSSTRHDYTVIGDVTNVASRLESATKEAGYRLVCSKVVVDALTDRGGLDALGPVAIKGHSPVDAFGWGRVERPSGPAKPTTTPA